MRTRQRRPPLVLLDCGHRQRSWSPHRECSRCVRERLSAKHAAAAARAIELERRLVAPTVEEREQVRARLAPVHARWLSRQSLDHPWRVAERGGGA